MNKRNNMMKSGIFFFLFMSLIIFITPSVSGADIYAAGIYTEGGVDKACYWKNGKKTDLPAGTSESISRAITIAGKDVYMAGACTEGGILRACYWKNGILINIHSVGASASYADDIKVVN
jgi:hypothetical protein